MTEFPVKFRMKPHQKKRRVWGVEWREREEDNESDKRPSKLQTIPLHLKKMTEFPVKFRMEPHQKKPKPRCRVEEEKESDKGPSKPEPIPLDVVEVEILTRLPVKSVMRSRCVSKKWSSIIRSQGFIDSYYAMSSATRSRFVVVFSNGVFVKGHAKRLFIFSGEESSSSSSLVAANLDMTIPSLTTTYRSKCPSVHGFVACCYINRLTICNPGTGQVVTLPSKGDRTSLGYDPVNQQFKALTLLTTRDGGFDRFTQHEVITLGGRGGESSRSMVTSRPYLPITNGLCLNGFVYYGAWETRKRTKTVIVCFDVRNEEFSFVTTPLDVLKRQCESELIEYKGKLAAVVTHDHPTIFGGFDLWILEDVKEHEWSRQTFKLPYDLSNVTCPGTNKAGEIVFATKRLSLSPPQPSYFYYYNLQTKDMRRVRIQWVADDQGFRRRFKFSGDCNVSVSLQHVDSIASL
uniref:F-box protein n=1 Tax=Noccaea caerulescens TaxID=107243 RepID=A0A1J3GN26_NOCCA